MRSLPGNTGFIAVFAMLVLTLGGVNLVTGCGGRTPLHAGFPCQVEGLEQACQRGCAEGTQICREGYWSECMTVSKSQSCENSCGTGIQHCIEGSWSTCEVAPVSRLCENLCGSGIETCVDDSWSDCAVDPVEAVCTFGCGDGTRSCVDNRWSACTAPLPEKTVIEATVRDFSTNHPDMEMPGRGGLDPGMVEPVLGEDGTPIYAAGSFGTTTSTGPDNFYQWYHDSSASQKTTVELELTRQQGNNEFYEYVDRGFFPIDGQLLGNEGNDHNYHFTLEAHESFIYTEGQAFNFEGDDDMWVFINGHMVINLGGLHNAISSWVRLDEVADDIGIELGGTYPLDIFFAERHTIASNFIIRTSITGLGKCAND